MNPTGITATHEPEVNILQISNPSDSNDWFIKVTPQGTVEFGPNYDPDESARIFWAAIEHWLPRCGNCGA